MFDNKFNLIKSAVIYEGKMYCSPGGGKAIYRIDMKQWKVDRMILLPYKNARYWNYFIYKDKIICTPHLGIAIFETDAELTYVNEIVRDNEEQELVDVVLEKDELYFIPRELPDDMWKYSLISRKMSAVDSWKNENIIFEIKGRINRWFTTDKSILFIIYSANRVYEFDFCENKMREIFLPGSRIWNDVVIWNDNYYAVSKEEKNAIICFDEEYSEIQKIRIQNNEAIKKIVPLSKDSILIETTTFLTIYNNGGFIEILNGLEKIQGSPFMQSICTDDGFVLLPWMSDLFVKMRCNYPNIETHQLRRNAKEIIDEKSIWNESELMLGDFVDAI